MSLNRKKYLITTEKYEVTIVQRTQVLYKYCAECKTNVEMLMLDAVTSTTGKRTREVFQLIEHHLVHSIETESGHLVVCRNSLKTIDTQKIIEK
jgi:hypothetical protein